MKNKSTFIEVLPWNKNFETGIASVDEQHRKLVDLLNRLAFKIVHDSGDLVLKQVIDELSDYAGYHFQSEEAVWEPCFHDERKAGAQQNRRSA